MAKISNLDFYAILGVHPNAEDIVIRAAFKALAQRYHPDRFNGAKDEAHRRMADLTNAYETLADPARRRKYDRRRGLASRQARFYFKNPARDRQQPYGALAARAAARKAQRYRMAVYVLMVVVVILSGFNLHQHSAQIKELFAWNRSSSGTIAVTAPIGTPAATTEAAPSSVPEAAPTSTTANVRVLPIGPANTRPISSNAPESHLPAPSAPDAAAAAPPTAPAEAMKAPPPAATEATKAPAQPAPIESQKAAVATPAAPHAADVPHKDARPPPPKPAVAKAVEADRPVAPPKPVVAKPAEPDRSVAPAPVAARPVEADRPAASPPAATDADRCTAAVAALGLCNRTGNAQGQ